MMRSLIINRATTGIVGSTARMQQRYVRNNKVETKEMFISFQKKRRIYLSIIKLTYYIERTFKGWK